MKSSLEFRNHHKSIQSGCRICSCFAFLWRNMPFYNKLSISFELGAAIIRFNWHYLFPTLAPFASLTCFKCINQSFMRFCDEQLTNIQMLCLLRACVNVCVCVTAISFHVDFVNLNYSFDTVNEFESLTYRKCVFFRIHTVERSTLQSISAQSIDRSNYANVYNLSF